MQITVQLPDDLAQHPNPGRDALEALAIEGYRSGALSAYQARLMLGFETRYELDGFLKEHGVWEHAYSVEDLEKDAARSEAVEAMLGFAKKHGFTTGGQDLKSMVHEGHKY